MASLSHRGHAAVELAYRSLGGRGALRRVSPGKWDIAGPGGLRIEFDEGNHFNRYRDLTLQTDWAQSLPWAESYRAFSADFEDLIRDRRPNAWLGSLKAQEMFGTSPYREFSPGPARWKIRALYDLVRDAHAVFALQPIRVARISIYDLLEGRSLNDIASKPGDFDRRALRELMEKRSAGPPSR